MPNWCWSKVTISASKESIDLIYYHMQRALSSDNHETDFGNDWLGNLLDYIGMLDEHGNTEDESIRYRGTVEWFERTDDYTIEMETESAWGPAITCIKLFVDNYVNDASILYYAIEPGMCLYLTNSEDYLDKVHLEGYDLDGVPEGLFPFEEYGDVSREELIETLQEILDTEETDLETLANDWELALQEFNEEASVYVHEYEYEEIGDNT